MLNSPNINMVLMLLTGLILLIILIKILLPRITSRKVKVNCWFCNTDSLVVYSKKNSWNCPSCTQYNGFNAEGDYNDVIKAQHDEKLNNAVMKNSDDKAKPLKGALSLCDQCNRNQLQKSKQLAAFVPFKEEMYDEEIEKYSKVLNIVYALCQRCEMVKDHILKQQNEVLSGVTNPNTEHPRVQMPTQRTFSPRKKVNENVSLPVYVLSSILFVAALSMAFALSCKSILEFSCVVEAMADLTLQRLPVISTFWNLTKWVVHFNSTVLSAAGCVTTIVGSLLVCRAMSRLKRVHIKTIVLWNLCCVVSIYVDYAQNSGTWFDFILSPMSIFKEQMSEPKYEGFAKNISSSFLCRNLTSILEIICSYFTLMFCIGCIYDLRKVQLCRKLLFTTPEKGKKSSPMKSAPLNMSVDNFSSKNSSSSEPIGENRALNFAESGVNLDTLNINDNATENNREQNMWKGFMHQKQDYLLPPGLNTPPPSRTSSLLSCQNSLVGQGDSQGQPESQYEFGRQFGRQPLGVKPGAYGDAIPNTMRNSLHLPKKCAGHAIGGKQRLPLISPAKFNFKHRAKQSRSHFDSRHSCISARSSVPHAWLGHSGSKSMLGTTARSRYDGTTTEIHNYFSLHSSNKLHHESKSPHKSYSDFSPMRHQTQRRLPRSPSLADERLKQYSNMCEQRSIKYIQHNEEDVSVHDSASQVGYNDFSDDDAEITSTPIRNNPKPNLSINDSPRSCASDITSLTMLSFREAENSRVCCWLLIACMVVNLVLVILLYLEMKGIRSTQQQYAKTSL